jgi:diaminohydroxyphosphoribosylaminopyrimidine deaminase / 5-amino-6-(5-phosphoribosylamino)uracil reductase
MKFASRTVAAIASPEAGSVPALPALRGDAGIENEEDPFSPVAWAPQSLPFVLAQLGQSLDGRIATVSGESRWINNGGALDHLHRLRARADGIVAGAGTIIADDPLLTVRRVAGRSPARIVIDPSGRVPATARCLCTDGVRRIVVTSRQFEAPAGVELIVLPASGGRICCHAIVDALSGLGLKRLLIEGGAATISGFIDAGAVDRLHLLVAPIIIGAGKTGLNLLPDGRLSSALRPKTRVFQLEGGDILFDCDMRS